MSFFLWTAALGKVLTSDNLRKRWLVVLDWCGMCRQVEKPLTICFSTAQWRKNYGFSFLYVWVDWVMPRTVMGLLFCWPRLSKRAVGSIWCMIPHCIMWSLWRERNARCFEWCEKTIHDLKKLFLYTLGMGCCCRNSFLLFSARFY